MFAPNVLAQTDPELWSAVRLENRRQEDHIELIASENYVSPEIIKTIALFRLILPKGTIKVAGGREANLRDLQSLALLAGANDLILGNYLTTLGRSSEDDLAMVMDLGFSLK